MTNPWLVVRNENIYKIIYSYLIAYGFDRWGAKLASKMKQTSLQNLPGGELA